ncbi:Detected protein of unknown function [Hibiscus syriacus]|uniref:LRR receptor-like serine/threonine-protein kinase n=1 Tax=Hibiscus syriacus TaxID=106335 RepID=A0A6A2ZFK7_HIBSY|nr:Detected protein of unknown function [Hibiscus syriacus]
MELHVTAIGEALSLAPLMRGGSEIPDKFSNRTAGIAGSPRISRSPRQRLAHKSGLVVARFGFFGNIERLELASNFLPGSIPPSLGSLQGLQVFTVSDNNLSGSIPVQFCNLSRSFSGFRSNTSFATAAVFNLSNNFFYGTLNFSLGMFRFIDLSGNYFQGKAVNGVERNVLVLVLVLILICNKGIGNQRGSADVGPVPEGDSPQHPKDPTNLAGSGDRFTYEQLLLATNNFSETNLIKEGLQGHSGDLFRGILEGGIPVVIKRINMSSLKNESYMMELDLFRKLSHPSSIPLLGHCLEHESDKLLFYKYMPNRDLANSFYGASNSDDDSLQSLDWITRLKVATGAAEGLFHLHHECNPSLVHRDVQANSILLDDKFEVRLGSLSGVRPQEGDTHQNVLRRLLWKLQTSERGPSGSSA